MKEAPQPLTREKKEKKHYWNYQDSISRWTWERDQRHWQRRGVLAPSLLTGLSAHGVSTTALEEQLSARGGCGTSRDSPASDPPSAGTVPNAAGS